MIKPPQARELASRQVCKETPWVQRQCQVEEGAILAGPGMEAHVEEGAAGPRCERERGFQWAAGALQGDSRQRPPGTEAQR